MRFTVSKEALLEPLQTVAGVVERRQNSPILSHILLEVTDENLCFWGSDTEVELKRVVTLIDPVPGTVTVPARKLLDICKSLPDKALLELQAVNNQVIVKSLRSRFVLASLPVEDFPKAEQDTPVLEMTVMQNTLRALLERTHFAIAQQDVRAYLNGLSIQTTPELLRMLTSDGHRLATGALSMPQRHIEPINIIVPRKAVLELLRLLQDSPQLVKLSCGVRQLHIEATNFSLSCKLIDGRFPEYHRVLPKRGDKIVTGSRDVFKEVFSRVSLLASDKQRIVKVQLEPPGILRVSSCNAEQELAEEEMDIDYTGTPLEIGFNATYLLEALASLEAGPVRLIFNDAVTPVLLESAVNDELHSLYVIMPLRL
jgi:DNA polymerase III subunit beta